MEELRTNDYLKGIVSNLPESPGIYQYLNTEGTIIYVGKAKSVFLLQPGARTGKDEGAGQQDCRYPIYRGEYGRRRAIAGKQSYQEIQASLQRTVERRQDVSQHLRAERILSTCIQNPEDNP